MHRSRPVPDVEAWFVIIAGETAGPFRTSLVVDLLERGSLGDNPLAWRAGFDSWLPLRDLEPFCAAYERWLDRRATTHVLSVDDLRFDPNATPPRTPPSPIAPLAAAETRPLAAVEFVAEPLLPATETKAPTFGRVSRSFLPRDEATGVYSLAALQQQATQAPPAEVPELPAFPPAALASVAVPVEPAPVQPTPIVPTPSPLPKAGSHIGLYAMMFLLLASIAGLAALVLLRDREPVVVADTSNRGDLSIASMSREGAPPPAEPAPAPAPDPETETETEKEIEPTPGPAALALPDKPTPEQLRAALAAVRPDARRCGPRLHAPAGTKIVVKLSIAGVDGRVIAAAPKARAPDDPIGRCVADALRAASFPSFRRPSLALLYAVTL